MQLEGVKRHLSASCRIYEVCGSVKWNLVQTFCLHWHPTDVLLECALYEEEIERSFPIMQQRWQAVSPADEGIPPQTREESY